MKPVALVVIAAILGGVVGGVTVHRLSKAAIDPAPVWWCHFLRPGTSNSDELFTTCVRNRIDCEGRYAQPCVATAMAWCRLNSDVEICTFTQEFCEAQSGNGFCKPQRP